jgi:hypothetical protein
MQNVRTRDDTGDPVLRDDQKTHAPIAPIAENETVLKKFD